jgi:PAS domain S-box-containing protein
MESDRSQLASKIGNLRGFFPTAILTCIVAVVCYQSDRLVYVLGIPPDHIASFWPPTSFLVALLLLVPNRLWPMLAAAGLGGMALSDLNNGVSVSFEVWISLGNLAEVILAMSGLIVLFKGVPNLNSLKTFAKYFVFAVVLVPLASALVGSTGTAPGGYWLQWRVWLFADALGFLTVAPAIWNWAAEGAAWLRRPRNLLELTTLVALLTLFGYFAFLRTEPKEQPALLYSLVPLLLWSALRLGVKGVSTSVLIVAFLSIWGSAHNRGPFAQQGPLNNALSLQLFLFFAAMPFMFLASLVDEQNQAQQALIDKDAQLTEAQRVAQMGSWEWIPDTDTVKWSEELYRIAGRDSSFPPPAYKEHAQLYTPESWQRLQAAVGESLRTGHGYELDLEIVRPDGSTRWVLARSEAHRDASGRIVSLRGTAKDITDRRNEEDRVRRREALLAHAEQLAALGSWELNLQTDQLTWSDNRYRLAGMHPQERPITLDIVRQFVHPEDLGFVELGWKRALEEGASIDNEPRFLLPNGQVRRLHTRAVPIKDSSGAVVRLVGITQDVTERREEEERLRRSEALLAQAEQIANIGSWEWNLETSEIRWSDHRYRLMGMAPGAPPPKIDDFWKLLHPEDRDRVRLEVQRAIAGAQILEYEARFSIGDGPVRVIHTRAVPTVDREGRTIRLTGMSRDITKEKQVNENLQRLSQELLRAQDTERRQIARELHESAGQTLAALKMTLGNLAFALAEGSEEAQVHLRAARGLAEDAVREVRVVSYLMHPPMLDDAGVAPALSWYIRGFSERSGIKANVEIPADFGRCSQEIETTIFRIVQEALTNVHRYSASRTVAIRLVREAGQVWAEIEDAGCGLPVIPHGGSKGIHMGVGIAGMRERVAQMNGTFEIESTPGRGTTVRVVLPLKKAPKSGLLPDG